MVSQVGIPGAERIARLGFVARLSTGPMLGPVSLEPLNLLVVELDAQLPVVEGGVLGIRFQVVRDVDVEAAGVDGE